MSEPDMLSMSQSILRTKEDAAKKCAEIQGKDVVVFMGCTGSGKTTVCAYVQNGKFEYDRGKLAPCQKMVGFESSDERQSVTHGIASAVVPNTDGLVLVDLAGTGDTAGDEVELCSGIYRSSVLRAARSVIIVLVMSLERAEVSNDRGKHAMRDLEHIAGLYRDLEANVRSVGLVVTNKPRFLRVEDAASETIKELHDAFHKLEESATPARDSAGLSADGSKDTGMRSTAAGIRLLKHFCSHLRAAEDVQRTIKEGEDDTFVERLLDKQCAIFPVNVLKEEQRKYLQCWLRSLQPIQDPQEALTYSLPTECRNSVERALSNASFDIRKMLDDKDVLWATDESCVDHVIKLLNIFVSVRESHLVPEAPSMEKELVQQLLNQNQNMVRLLCDGIRQGNVPMVDRALRALEHAGVFRKKVPPQVKMNGWSSTEAAMHDGVKTAEETLASCFPDGLKGAKWDMQKANEVGGVFDAVRRFEHSSTTGANHSHPGQRFLSDWAKQFGDHVSDLKAITSECADLSSVIQAFARLNEYQSRWTGIIAALSEYGCKDWCASGLEAHYDDAKAKAKARLQEMSRSMVESRQQSGSEASPEWDALQKFCRSTELNNILGEGLEGTLMMEPLSAALAPSQSEIDSLSATIQQAEEIHEYRMEVEHMSVRIQSLGDLATQILEAGKVHIGPLVEQLISKIAGHKKVAKDQISAMKDTLSLNHVAHVRSNVSERSSTSDGEWTCIGPDPSAIESLDTLSALLVVDPLLRLAGQDAAKSAAMALESTGCGLRSALQKLLDKCRRTRSSACTVMDALSAEACATIKGMQVLLEMASSILTSLKGLSEQGRGTSKDLLETIQHLEGESHGFIKDLIKEQLDAIDNASAGVRGWHEVFADNFRTLEKIKHLSDDVVQAKKRLIAKVTQWCNERYDRALEAADDDGAWQDFILFAVTEGMSFEQSSLRARLELKKKFQPLVDSVAGRWQKAADSAKQDERIVVWSKLTALHKSVERLPSTGDQKNRDYRDQLCRDLVTARAPLDRVLQDDESRFQTSLQQGRLSDAGRLLSRVQNPERLRESLAEACQACVDRCLKALNQDGEIDDMVNAAKDTHGILHDEAGLSDVGQLPPSVEPKLAELRQLFETKKVEARDNLQLALNGTRPASRELAICAALVGKSRHRMAQDALAKFAQDMKATFPKMSLNDLLTWIMQQSNARSKMPEELSFSDPGLVKDWLTNFSLCFKKGIEQMEECLNNSQWGEAKQLHNQLRDAVEHALRLDVLQTELNEIKKWKNRLGIGGRTVAKMAAEQMKEGDFKGAINSLVTGDGGDAEEALLDAIKAALADNMNVIGVDDVTMQKKLKALKSFRETVGKHPPDELRNLCVGVNTFYQQERTRAESRAVLTFQQSSAKVANGELSLAALIQGRARCHALESFVPEETKTEFDNAVKKQLQNMRRAMEKVGNDIRNKDENALGLDLEPARKWLDEERSLPVAEKGLVKGLLGGEEESLRVWMLNIISQPLRDLNDATSVRDLLSKHDFSKIRILANISRKLHEILLVPCVDLRMVQDYVLQKKEASMQALIRSGDNLHDFNREYKILKSIHAEFPDMHGENHVAEVERALRDNVLQAKIDSLSKASSPPEICKAIVDLRNVANQAPDTHEDVTKHIAVALDHFQKHQILSMKQFNVLGGLLGEGALGQQIIAENPKVFSATRDFENNVRIRRAGETLNADEVVGRLTRDSRLDGVENRALKATLDHHEAHYRELILRNLGGTRGQDRDVVLREAKADLDKAVAACRNREHDSARMLLTHLAACYTTCRCTKEEFESPKVDFDRLVMPHRGQMLTLFRLLRVHKPATAPDAWMNWIWNKMQGRDLNAATPENHLAQVLTGEGKCITLGLLASFLGLLGVESDIACYHEILTEQDRSVMLPFYQYIGIASPDPDTPDMVRYVSFDQLCRQRLAKIKSGVSELLDTGHVSDTKAEGSTSQRALLIDEVDVLFGRLFGNTWDGGFQLKSKEAKALIRYIFQEKRSGRQVTDITCTEPFTALLQSVPEEMHRAMHGVAAVLVENYESCLKPEPILDQKKGRIGYKEKHEVNYNLSHANKTSFAYLYFEMEGKLSPEHVDEHIGIDLCCGRFSFADLPKQYACILGVTGTLVELLNMPFVKKMLEDEYKFKHTTYAPSIFGQRNLTFREGEDVIIRDNEADWISAIESVAENHVRKNNAVLIFFKNETELKKYPGWETLECLTERTDAARRNGYIAAATMEGRKTLATKTYGRGIDYQMHDSHTVVVLQTFLSSMPSETTQIMGRTARQGKHGQYHLVLCSEHLEGRMGFAKEDIQLLKSGGGEGIRQVLAIKQFQKTRAKVLSMQERKDKAISVERDTKAWEAMLFDTKVPSKDKLAKLAEYNSVGCYREVHYTLMLDQSGSMGGRPWHNLAQAFKSFLQALKKDKAAAAVTKVSVVLFNHEARAVAPDHARVTDVQDIAHHVCGGGTNFAAAFEECHRIIGLSSSGTKEMLIFFTDGADCACRFGGDTPTAVGTLVADHGARIESLMCVGFGGGVDGTALSSVGEVFKQKGIKFQVTMPGDEASLVKTFCDAASGGALHTV